eukprot:7693723-Ditylum_brightwellii.AAC.1
MTHCQCFATQARNHAITREVSLGGSLSSLQDLPCARGKYLLKYEQRGEFARKYLPYLNDCDDTSAMTFSSPGMFSGVRLEALVACSCMSSRRSNLAAGRDFDVLSFCSQLTAEALSQNMP